MNETEAYELERAFNAARVGKGLPPVAWAGPFVYPPAAGKAMEMSRYLEKTEFLHFCIEKLIELPIKKPYETPVLHVNRPEDFNRLFECGLGQEFYARLVSNW